MPVAVRRGAIEAALSHSSDPALRVAIAPPTTATFNREPRLQPQIVQAVRNERIALFGSYFRQQAYGLSYPFGSLRQALMALRIKRWLWEHPPVPENAVAYANAYAEKSRVEIGAQVRRVWELSQFGEMAKAALSAGAIFAGAGAAIGSVFPGVGTVIGAAIGFVVGLFAGLFPVEKWGAMDRFSAIVRDMRPIERYLLWQAVHRIMSDARKLDNKAPLPDWIIKEPGVFYTIWGSGDAVWLFNVEELWRSDAFPCAPYEGELDLASLDAVSLYALGVCASWCPSPQASLKDSEGRWQEVIEQRKGTQALREVLYAFRESKASEVRSALARRQFPNFDALPITPRAASLIDERESAIRAELGT